MTRPIPLRADPGALVARNVTAVARVAIAKAVARTERRSDDMAILKERFPDDPLAPLVLRAASQPSMLATDTALGRSVVADLIATIGPVGAGARLLQSGLQLVFENDSTIYVPGLEATANAVSFVQEGAPIPVHSLVSKSVALVPRKLATIVTLTSEMLVGSNAEALVTDALTRSVGLALDSALFDSAAADLVRPAGLRHGITAHPRINKHRSGRGHDRGHGYARRIRFGDRRTDHVCCCARARRRDELACASRASVCCPRLARASRRTI